MPQVIHEIMLGWCLSRTALFTVTHPLKRGVAESMCGCIGNHSSKGQRRQGLDRHGATTTTTTSQVIIQGDRVSFSEAWCPGFTRIKPRNCGAMKRASLLVLSS